MSAAVAKKRRPRPKPLSEDRIEVRAETAWMDRLDRVAASLHLTRSAYIRLRLTEAMNADEARLGLQERK